MWSLVSVGLLVFCLDVVRRFYHCLFVRYILRFVGYSVIRVGLISISQLAGFDIGLLVVLPGGYTSRSGDGL